ncbi:MAG TPA: hypothetical protein PLP19_01630 [bacterium]|nr:hypothetical protein [bacterium]HPN42166.1 hypothetical protein [bacterium]
MNNKLSCNRRTFIKIGAWSSAALLLNPDCVKNSTTLKLGPPSLLGNLSKESGAAPLENAAWYHGAAPGDGLLYLFPQGALADYAYLTFDMLLDGKYMCAFIVSLQEGEYGRVFTLNFKLLNQCSARARIPATVVDQNKWQLPREGAWLKPLCGDDRVDLHQVDRLSLTILRNGGQPVRFCLADLLAVKTEPPRLSKPLLPKGKLLDEMGQSTLHNWPGKSASVAQVTERLQVQLAGASQARWPEQFSRWGGWLHKKFRSSGYFGKHWDGQRWWLVDPDGYAFWSSGVNCVRVDTAANCEGLTSALSWLPEQDGPFKDMYSNNGNTINYLAGNFIRAFGAANWYKNWSAIALSELKRIGFNTVANWSDWKIASQAQIPYMRPLNLRLEETKQIYRNFPDVYSVAFAGEADGYAKQLEETVNDPAMIGYFLMNEPTWGFSTELPAAGMLYNTPFCETRRELARELQKRYGSDAALSAAWQIPATLAQVAEGDWQFQLTPAALQDLARFSETMVVKFFQTLSDACRRVDPNHLNLGARYHTIPPVWALKGMKCFDIFSMNCYHEKIPAAQIQEINRQLGLPTLIGEFHFGALDAGLPATGIGHVQNQAARGQAYRYYIEDAAANPWCVGAHWFTLYDQSALGRGDGENYNIGFLDVCNNPYVELVSAARQTHSVLYEIAAQRKNPVQTQPEYLDKLY